MSIQTKLITSSDDDMRTFVFFYVVSSSLFMLQQTQLTKIWIVAEKYKNIYFFCHIFAMTKINFGKDTKNN